MSTMPEVGDLEVAIDLYNARVQAVGEGVTPGGQVQPQFADLIAFEEVGTFQATCVAHVEKLVGLGAPTDEAIASTCLDAFSWGVLIERVRTARSRAEAPS